MGSLAVNQTAAARRRDGEKKKERSSGLTPEIVAFVVKVSLGLDKGPDPPDTFN